MQNKCWIKQCHIFYFSAKLNNYKFDLKKCLKGYFDIWLQNIYKSWNTEFPCFVLYLILYKYISNIQFTVESYLSLGAFITQHETLGYNNQNDTILLMSGYENICNLKNTESTCFVSGLRPCFSNHIIWLSQW